MGLAGKRINIKRLLTTLKIGQCYTCFNGKYKKGGEAHINYGTNGLKFSSMPQIIKYIRLFRSFSKHMK